MSNDKFLCNGTRVKLAFLEDDDADGEPIVRVTALNNFQHELDGRWVALVPAEDDCHLIDDGREGWHKAVLAECTSVEGCYQESDPAKTVRDLIEWHRKDAVWHYEQDAAGRVAAPPAPVGEMAVGLAKVREVACLHRFMFFGDQSVRRCADCNLIEPVAQKADAEPMFWVRLRSDGGYEGPLHNDSIEAVRKESGAWTPLYTTPQAPALTDSERLDAKSYRYLRQISCNMQFDESELYKAFSAAGYTEEPPTEAQFDSVIRGIVAAKQQESAPVLPELHVYGWLTDDGRIATASTKEGVIPKSVQTAYCHALCKVSDALAAIAALGVAK